MSGIAAIFLLMLSILGTRAANGAGDGLIVGARSRALGKVGPRARIAWTVILTNSTSKDVEISDVRTSCSCFVPPWRSHRLPAGGGLEMQLELITSDLSGPFEEQLEFKSSHPADGLVRLEIGGEVFRPVEAVPAFAMLQVTPDSWNDEIATVRILNHEPQPLEVMGLKSMHPSFVANLTPVHPGFEYLLQIRLTQSLPNGNHYGRIELTTSSTNIPKLEVTAFVPGLPAVAIGPRSLRFPASPSPNTTSSPVYIRSTTTHALTLAAPSIPSHTRAILEQVEAGRLFRLLLVTESGFRFGEATNISVRLESNHPAHPLLQIPVFIPSSETSTNPLTAPR